VTSTVEDAPDQASTASRDITLADWLRARPGRTVSMAAGSMVLLQLVFRGWASAQGYFSLDDFYFVGRAAGPESLSHVMLTSYNDHFMPGAFLLVDVLTRLAPLGFGTVVAASLALQAGASWLVWRLLVRLCGRRPALLVPFAVYLYTVVTLPAFLWYAVWLNQLPQQIAMAGAALLHVRYLQEGRRRDGLLAVAAVAGGLLFYEKTILTVGLLYLLTALWFTPGAFPRGWWRAMLDHRVVWSAHAGLVAAYAGLYLSRDSSALSSSPTAAQGVDIVQSAIGSALLPAFAGGPWAWLPVGFSDASADPGRLGQVVGWVLVAVVLELSVLVGIRAWRAWLTLAVYTAAAMALLILGRGGSQGAIVGLEFRYLTDVAVVASICLALAFLGARGGVDDAANPPSSRLEPLRHGLARPGTIGVLVVALFASSAVSTVHFVDRWSDNPARPWMANALADADRLAGAVVVDGEVPEEVVWPVLAPYHLASNLLAPRDPQLRWDALPSEQPLMFGADGHLVRALVQPAATGLPGTDPGCGHRVTPHEDATIELTEKLFAWRWAGRLGYIASRDGDIVVTTDGSDTTLPVSAGLHEVFWYTTGTAQTIQISTTTPDLVFCTDELTIGRFVPMTPGPGGAQ
jgi:hypothetical protein